MIKEVGPKQLVVDRLSGKLSKEDSNYRSADEKNSKESCFECEHYLSPGEPESACRRVAGIVYAEDVCDLMVARAEEGVGTATEE